MVWLLIVILAGWADAAGQSAVSMPRGFADVRLGISESKLKELRPAAAPFDIFNEREEVRGGSPSLLIEFLAEDPFFDSVDYTLVADRLCIVKWALISQPEDFIARRARILSGAMRKWGDDFGRVALSLKLDSTPSDASAPVGLENLFPGIRWIKEGVEILISYTPSGGAARAPEGSEGSKTLPNLIHLSIYDRSCLSPEFEKTIGSLLTVTDDLPPEFFRDLQAKTSGMLFE
jgi:hypothetical protein